MHEALAAEEQRLEEETRREAAVASANGAAMLEQQALAAAKLASLEGATGSDESKRISCVAKLPNGSRVAFSLPTHAPLVALWWSIE